MSSPHPIRLLPLLTLVSSCDMTEEERRFPPHPATAPFTCESPDYFIRTADENFGHEFFIDDPTKVFYSFSDNRISKYGLPDLQLKKSKSLSLGETIYHASKRDETSAWLFTGTISGNLFAYAVDTALNITHQTAIHLSSLGIITGTTDGGFVMATNLHELGNDKFSVLRYSDTGTLMWRQDPAAANPRTIVALKDGSFLVGGDIPIFEASFIFQNDFLTKLNSDGKVLWTKSSHAGDRNNTYSIENVIEDDSGDYFLLLANQTKPTNLLRTDSAFSIRWSTVVASAGTLSGAGDGILLLSSRLQDDSHDIFFEYFNDDGDLTWTNQFGGAADEGASVFSRFDGGYYLIGGTTYYPEPGYLGVEKGYLIKTDLEGRSCQ